MSTQKPDLTRVWASGAPPSNVVDPDTTTSGKVSAGWQAEVPPFEHFNFLQKWFSQGLAHSNEQGIMIWDNATTYPIDGIAKGSDGELYRAITENTNIDPVSDNGTNWIPLIPEAADYDPSNREYATVEQFTDYTLSPNRHVFGEEYLWGYHTKIFNGANQVANKFIWSGDSTTAGDNAGAWPPSTLAGVIGNNLGLSLATHVNSGHSGKASTDWDTTYVAQDITNHPDMDVYMVRWGINDGSAHGNLATYIAAMDSGLSKLRAHKEVDQLTIIVMAPSSTYDDPNNRGTDWYEAIIPELRKICRKYRAVFFDTYSIWQDAKQGALAGNPRWLDDPFGDGRGIHPDAVFNHQIISRVMRMILVPILDGQNYKANNFLNTHPDQFNPIYGATPSQYTVGHSLWEVLASDGWPTDGRLSIYRNGNKVIQELTVTNGDGVAPTKPNLLTIKRYGDAVTNTWGKWYNLTEAPALFGNWGAVAGRTVKLKHMESGLCSLQGTVDGDSDSVGVLSLPEEMRPDTPRTFRTAGENGVVGVIIQPYGSVEIVRTGGTGFAHLDGCVWFAGE